MSSFDATITLCRHQLAAAGVPTKTPDAVIIKLVRDAVSHLTGDGYVDVTVQRFPPSLLEWVAVYPHGLPGDTEEGLIRHQQRAIEETIRGALVAIPAADQDG